MPDNDTLCAFYSRLAQVHSMRSTCLRRTVGAIAVKKDRVIASGFNGQVSGAPHCAVCMREKEKIESGTQLDRCKAVHAEQNVITQAAAFGISLQGSTLYCTDAPCFICAKQILNAGISAIVYEYDYGVLPDVSDLYEEMHWGRRKLPFNARFHEGTLAGMLTVVTSRDDARDFNDILKGLHRKT